MATADHRKLYVGNLPYSYTEADLAELFSRYSPRILSVVQDRETGRSKGFGFVEVPQHAAAEAIADLNGRDWAGRDLVVNEVRPRSERPLGSFRTRSWGNLDDFLDEVPQRLAAPSLSTEELRDLLHSKLRGADTAGLLRPESAPGDPAGRRLADVIMAKPRIDDEAVRLLAHHPELLYTLSPRQFEEIVADILVRSGFNHVHLTPPSRDGGVDIYAKKDDLVGTSLYLVECKLWRPENPVGRPVLQKLYGVLADKRANKAVVVATTRFTKDAREWAADKPYQMALRDYDAVTTWLGQCLDEG
ncbi:hypothetical protein Afe04nite_16180 [Asanoa ferruginea]|nr:restriction endonuclease [Asanoa ferruginea]GIF47079.1 hypothetical protein Afe04nite_16180 [Asanoa ferruginea]